jgi:hypothetical protein
VAHSVKIALELVVGLVCYMTHAIQGLGAISFALLSSLLVSE